MALDPQTQAQVEGLIEHHIKDNPHMSQLDRIEFRMAFANLQLAQLVAILQQLGSFAQSFGGTAEDVATKALEGVTGG